MPFTQYQLEFNSPWYLLLLLALPLLWWYSRHSLAGLGRFRRSLALTLRGIVFLLLVLAVAEMQFRQTRDSITVIYLLDQSESIPAVQRRAMLAYAREAVERHREPGRKDKAAVIAFGQNPAVEIGPIEDELPLGIKIESFVDGEFSDLESAMKMAKALFPEDGAKRIVVISDGNENVGDARKQARQLASTGVGIDVLPLYLGSRSEVAVEKVALPSDVRRGQPFQLRVVLNNFNDPAPDGSADVTGKLRIVRKAGDEEITLVESPVTLPPGKTVIAPDVPETIERPDFYTYEATFVPDEPTADNQGKNNVATSFTQVRGKGQVLLIVDWANKEELPFYQEFARRMGEQEQGLQVTIKPSNQLFDDLSDLQRYDTVVLANVPRTSGDAANELTHFSDEQISMLVRNTQQLGAGLVMLGGPNSFGAGGWTSTELEKAMPVDFEIKNLKVETVGALALIMHAGEMPQGNFWQKVIAREAIKALGGQNYAGMLHWDGTDSWMWKENGMGMVRVQGNKDKMLAMVDRMSPGDMPQFDPTMRMAAAGMAKLKDAAVKHMIIISDGDPSPPSAATIKLLTGQDPPVQVTTVAVGSHGFLGHKVLKDIASATGGKYYVVSNPKTLPKIYQQEARKLARPLVYEPGNPFAVNVYTPHEILQGIGKDLPPIKGFVMTSPKESPLVEIGIKSSQPAGKDNVILATWTYGLGRTVAFTTDAGLRWATSWDEWEHYNKFFSQMIRWSMRPIDDTGRFLVSSDVKDGEVRVVVTAWDENEEPLNLLNLSGTVVGPGEDSPGLTMQQTAPGRYVGKFDADASGSYFVMLNPGAGKAPIRTGVNVPYSAEYRDRETNMSLLRYLASLSPLDGEVGELIGVDNPETVDNPPAESLPIEGAPAEGETVAPEESNATPSADQAVRIAEAISDPQLMERLLETNIYRETLAKPTVSSPIWPWLLFFGACFFFFDVFFRRVQISLAWIPPLVGEMRDSLMGRDKPVVADQRLERLRSRKAEISTDIDRRRASTRFEPTADAPVDDALSQPEAPKLPTSGSRQTTMAAEEADEPQDSYTRRLMKAKQAATKKNNK